MKGTSGNLDAAPWPEGKFTANLRAVGGQSYHDKHPFHLLMNEGKLTRRQLQGWALNRFYYQSQIPVKDAAILSNCPERDLRRVWIQRIADHDGSGGDIGGIEKWLRLGEAMGLYRTVMLSHSQVLPGVRYAVDAYVNFCRTEPWIIAMASSLTELFAPTLMSQRITAFEQHYPWVKADGLAYFRGRLTLAPRDSDFTLRLVLERCRTRELQEQAVAALQFKCELLWAILDAIHLAYVLTPPPVSSDVTDHARPRLAAKARLKWDAVREKHLLLFPEGALVLNPTAREVLELCDGSRTVAEISRTLADRYKNDAVGNDVKEVLQRLADKSLVKLNA